MPKVSVIIPAYNAEAFLSRALRSVQEQTLQPDEVIVIDDGSTDKTAEVARSFQGVKLLQQANRGQAAARNVGIEAAKGEYVAFLDADDEWLPEKLERQLSFMREKRSRISYTDTYHIKNGARRRYSEIAPPRTGEILVPLLRQSFITTNTVIAQLELLKRDHFSEEEAYRGHEDYEFWLRLAYRTVRFDYLDQPLAVYHSQEMSSSSDELYMQQSVIRTLEKILGDWKLESEARYQAELQISEMAGAVARTMLRQGRAREANYFLAKVRFPSWRQRAFYAVSRIFGARPAN